MRSNNVAQCGFGLAYSLDAVNSVGLRGASILKSSILAAVLAVSAGASSASTTTILLGDKDCFGFGGVCADDTSLPFGYFDNSTALDPAGTDQFGTLGTLEFEFSFSLGGEVVTSASVTVRTAGMNMNAVTIGANGDGLDGTAFFMNGTLLGTYYSEFISGIDNSFAINTLTFSIAPNLLVEGINTLRILPEQDLAVFGVFEDYAVDYVELGVESSNTPPPNSVPLPAGALILLSSFGALAALRAHRTKSTFLHTQ